MSAPPEIVPTPSAPDGRAVLAAVAEPERLSASTLMAAERCQLAAFLARQTGDPSGEDAVLGNHFHDIAAQVGFQAKLLGRETFTPDEVEAVAERVLQHPDEGRPLSRAHFDGALELARRWALTAHFPVGADWYEVEVSVRHELAGQVLSGRIDLLAVEGTTAEIEDYKSGRRVPTQREVEEEHVQLPTYAWHVHRRAPAVETFVLREHYVRSGAVREVILDLDDVARHERWLRTTAMRFRAAWATRGFKPTPGKHCKYCPNPMACPLPEVARPESITDPDQAAAQLGALLVEEARARTRKKMIRAALTREEGRLDAIVAGDSTAYIEEKDVETLDRRALEAAGVDLAPYLKPGHRRELKVEGVR